ncbi:MAG: carbamoyltransferase HypF [Thermoanaerobaculia bacterium]
MALTPLMEIPRSRMRLRVQGVVQGVGFRPFVYRLATEEQLSGFVRNDAAGVEIEIEGDGRSLARFHAQLRQNPPLLAQIETIDSTPLRAIGEQGFRIVESDHQSRGTTDIPADSATCQNCLSELFDPSNRRFLYPFINCTDCGPRFSIIRELPYDRGRTTMAAFDLCADCRTEYEDPASRRFHAEPNACARCGPRLTFGGAGRQETANALEDAIAALGAGSIVAVKGIGGFHLAVDATNEAAVARLRQWKHRPDQPFAVMARDMETVDSIAVVSPPARRELLSIARPIVLMDRRHSTVAPSVAPRLREIGVMLPYTPLHHLLAARLPLLVMTSGNLSGEPIVTQNDEALRQLQSVADLFLLHDRDIHSPADDSVLRIIDGTSQPARRSRGLVPRPVSLPLSGPSVLATGAQQKNTICITRGSDAYLSQHIGDLGSVASQSAFEVTIEKMTRLLGVRPEIVAHDLHPDYASTRWALQSDLKAIPVQHHHAHIASCLAEHQRTDTVIGVAFDGTGCGPAGEIWGGEFLVAGLNDFQRLLHLRPLPLPGGEAAIREPWRLALAALLDCGEDPDFLSSIDARRRQTVCRMIGRDVHSPPATSAGRWFDAVAALCGIGEMSTYEAQAAIELESIADKETAEPYPFAIDQQAVDLRPAIREIVAALRQHPGRDHIARVSARFHETIAQVIRDGCHRIQASTGIRIVALSGGCFQNRLLSERAKALLTGDGFEVLMHHHVPPSDGGIALGQAAVALYRCGGADHVSRNSR